MERATAERSEEVLHGVSEFGHALMTDRRGRALQGVGRPEDLVDHTRVEVVLQVEEALLNPPDLLERLIDEDTVVARLKIEGQPSHGSFGSGNVHAAPASWL